MVKEGALVVDIGINREGDRIVGDVDFEPACRTAGAITPVPGGVGPVSLSMFLKNVVACARLHFKL
jgi:methylenetetrahydrofolate dehydrogenase (NADP+)/methenyltetrahydrofolate cyclohydrolase